MNNDLDQTIDLIKELKSAISKTEVDIMIAPSFPFLKVAFDLTKNTNIEVISQNVNENNSGAFTGEVSVDMLIDCKVKYVILGHSERRTIFGEDDELIRDKVSSVINADMIPVLCIGETIEELNEGLAKETVYRQLKIGLSKVDSLKDIVIAYEPVWAIGTGLNATSKYIDEIHGFLKDYCQTRFALKQNVSVVYGGSVKLENCEEILSSNNVDGLLIGGASLDPETFSKIYNFS